MRRFINPMWCRYMYHAITLLLLASSCHVQTGVPISPFQRIHSYIAPGRGINRYFITTARNMYLCMRLSISMRNFPTTNSNLPRSTIGGDKLTTKTPFHIFWFSSPLSCPVRVLLRLLWRQNKGQRVKRVEFHRGSRGGPSYPRLALGHHTIPRRY